MPNPNHRPWTEQEFEQLRQAYSFWPIRKDLLPERSKASIHSKALELGLTRRRTAPAALDISDTDWAYFAGIVDGEGHIATKRSGVNKPSIIIGNTSKELIDWLMERVPGASCYSISPEKMNSYPSGFQGHTKPQWIVTYARMDVVASLLKGMMPYLTIKREKAQEALDLLGSYPWMTR